MKKTWLTIDSALREAIVCEGQTYNGLAVRCGVPAASLCRFINEEGGLTVASADKLFDYFGLVVVKKPKAKPKTTKGRK